MVKDHEELFERIRTRIHELATRDQEIFTKVALTELNLSNLTKDVESHDVTIRKLEKFMYTALGISIGAHVAIELIFKAMVGH